MDLRWWFERAASQRAPGGGILGGTPSVHGLEVEPAEWQHAALDMANQGGRLLSLWASPSGDAAVEGPAAAAGGEGIVRAAFIAEPGVLVLSLHVAAQADYPGI